MTAGRLVPFAAALATAAAIITSALFWSHSEQLEPAPPPPALQTQPVPGDGTWAAAAAALPLTSRSAVVPEYTREGFGERWADIDGNGCEQRDDVLARDLQDPVRDGCAVTSGTLTDPYSGTTVQYPSERTATDASSERRVQIDYVVGLRAAHDGGAWKWTAERRLQFANSIENMLAVDSASAQEKGRLGPGRWLPARAEARCDYAIRYTWIASAWELAVPLADRDALTSTLLACGR